MDRARRAGSTALIVVAMIAAPVARMGRAGSPSLAATVGWPPSTLVVSEVQTGGASASDEFVELANQGGAPTDLLGLEVVYATSSGSHGHPKGDLGTSRDPCDPASVCSWRTRRGSTWPSGRRDVHAAGSRRPAAPSRCESWAAR